MDAQKVKAKLPLVWLEVFKWMCIPILGFIAYLYTLKIGFIWDDYAYIEQQMAGIKGFNIWKGLGSTTYYRPTVAIFSILDYIFYHQNPIGYHITNITLHLLNSLLVAVLAKRLIELTDTSGSAKLQYVPWLSGLIFALHPIHTESVNWIEGRTDLICTFTFLLAVFSYIECRIRKSIVAFLSFIIFTFFAVFAKEPAIAIFAIVAAWEFIIFKNKKTAIITTLLCGLTASIVLALRAKAIERILNHYLSYLSITDAVDGLIRMYGFYIKKIIYPFPLSFFIGSLPEGQAFLVFSALTLIMLILLAIFTHRLIPVVSCMIVWWIVTILPHGIILLGGSAVTPVAERYLYLPSVAFSIGLSMLMFYAISSHRRIAWGVIVLILVLYGSSTFHRTMLWTDEEKFWEDTVRKAQDFGLPYEWYGKANYDKGKLEEAINIWKQGLERPYMIGKNLDTGGANTKNVRANLLRNIALGYLRLEDVDTAMNYLLQAKELIPNYHTYYLLGIVERRIANKTDNEKDKREHLEKALYYLERSVNLNSRFQQSSYVLALTYENLNLTTDAEKYFQRVIEIDPRTKLAVAASLHLRKIKAMKE